MNEYTPPFRITNEILSYVASISEKVCKILILKTTERSRHHIKIG